MQDMDAMGDEIRVLFELRGENARPNEIIPGIAQRADRHRRQIVRIVDGPIGQAGFFLVFEAVGHARHRDRLHPGR